MVRPVKREPGLGGRTVAAEGAILDGTGAETSRQEALERRALRSRYLAVKNLISDERDDISRSDSQRFKSIISEVEALHRNVKKPREQVADAETLLDIAKTLVSSVRSESTEGVTPSDFVTAILKNFSHVEHREQDDNSQNVVSWEKIGISLSHIFQAVSGCCTMIGPMSNEIRQRKVAVHRKRTRPTDSIHPEEIDCDEPQAKTDTDNNVLTMFDVLKRKRKVRLENLLLNRLSFAQTVENIFALSFLVKDGRAEITVDEKGCHLVSPRNAPAASAVASGEVSYHHFIFRFDFKDWKENDKESSRGDLESLEGKPIAASDHAASRNNMYSSAGSSSKLSSWKLKSIVTLALTLLTSSQSILIVWSKRAGKYEYSITTANFSVEALKCAFSLAALFRIWSTEGVTENNRLSTSFDEVSVYPIPAALYLVKNLLQYYIFAYVDAPAYQILKNLNIISTGVLYRLILKRKPSEIQWAAFILLCAGCTTAQLNSSSDHVLQTPLPGFLMAIVIALLSGFAGVYTEAIIKKRPSRNINVQNFWLYIFGMLFNMIAIFIQDFDAVANNGFFHGYSFITVCMILNHALSGIAVSMVMKFADNIVKVYATSVAMLLTAIVSVFLFGFQLSLAFFLGTTVVSVSVYLHSIGKPQR